MKFAFIAKHRAAKYSGGLAGGLDVLGPGRVQVRLSCLADARAEPARPR